MKCWRNLVIATAGAGLVWACLIRDAGAGDSGNAPSANTAVALYDTVEAGQLEAAISTLGDKSWKQVKPGGTFQGDGVLVNNRLAAVVRKDGSGVDVFAKGEGDRWTRRARLVPLAANTQRKLSGFKAVETGEGSIGIETSVEGTPGAALVFEIDQPGFPAVKAIPRGKLEALRFFVPCRLGVLPDFWADDLMIDAKGIPVDRMEVPADNIFLHLAGEGNALVAAVWERNEGDIEVALTGEGDSRAIVSTDVFVQGGGNVWAAVLEQKGIWHAEVFKPEKGKKLDWQVPFVAKWKGNVTLSDGTVVSRLFKYRPSWYDGRVDNLVNDGNAYAAVLTQAWEEILKLGSIDAGAGSGLAEGSLLAAYPITREKATPLDQYCTDDLLRLLGTQVCSYILDLDARQGESRAGVEKGIYTCADSMVVPTIMPQAFPRNERALAQFVKDERVYLRLMNAEVLRFITLVQDRINSYVNFRKDLLAYLDGEEKKHPELAGFIGRLRTQLTKPVPIYGRPVDSMKFADGAKQAAPLLAKRALPLEVDTPENALGALTGLRSVGDPQDGRVQGERLKVARLRVMAAMEAAVNPAAEELAKEVRKRVQDILRNPTTFEKPLKW